MYVLNSYQNIHAERPSSFKIDPGQHSFLADTSLMTSYAARALRQD